MTVPGFVERYDDLSVDDAYRFKFYCDKCTRSWESTPAAPDLRQKLLKAADKIVGGAISEGQAAAREAREALGDHTARTRALQDAVEEAQRHFRHCRQCGKWVCPDYCWNSAADRCDECAPNPEEQETVKKVRALDRARQERQAAQDRMYEKQNVERYLKGTAAFSKTRMSCPKCGATDRSGKFCNACGAPLPTGCKKCGAQNEPGARFCSECGTEQ